ncbi:GGDEF domain-containing protein [Oribacterium sp. WCC10]|uniref:GGDEF domain-containing protein n=1 Tax=Oribacterium sp. WCC10 TaxID=1855343 RepID=UPI0008EB08A6|nr:GGDEF domain-containing protein [Oribacterium sp. WCC10]SFG15835.1 diguanylate cyclase (GGDEF) domain-containing protein [Oribacterium sp. WCC10]
MDTTNYSQDIIKKLNDLEEYKTETFEITIRICNELLAVARRRKDQSLSSLCNYYIARYYFNMRNCSECVRYLKKSIKEANESSAQLEMCRALTLLASTFTRQGNKTNAMQTLSTVIRVAESNIEDHHEFAHILIRSYEDLSDLCYTIGNYQEGLKYQLATDRLFYHVIREGFYPIYYMRHLCSLVRCYVLLGDTTNAGDIISQIDNFVQENKNSILEPYVSVAHIIWNEYTGDHKWDDVYIDKLNTFFSTRNFKGDFIPEFFFVLNLLTDNDNYVDYFKNLVVKMENYLNFTDLYGFKQELSNIKINFYETSQNDTRKVEELERFREYANAGLQAQNRAMSLLIEVETMSVLDYDVRAALEKRTVEDDLTGLPNRKSFNDMADRFFERCAAKELNFGIAMMTIDNVKRINDMYGYSIGDRCLIEFSNILKRYASEHLFVARYVGAEFVVLFENFSDDEVIDRLRNINDDVLKSIRIQELPEFTLSQGVCIHKPEGLNKIWDYTSCADLALIKAMQIGTGQAILVHNISELNNAHSTTLNVAGKVFNEIQ